MPGLIYTPDGVTYSLDFVLVVETLNHQIIQQTPDDKSRHGNGSFYGDIKLLKLRRASLVGKGHITTVDLIDGHMEIDGRALYPPKQPPIGAKFELQYFRAVQQRVMVGPEGKELVPVIRYFIGWKIENGPDWTIGLD